MQSRDREFPKIFTPQRGWGEVHRRREKLVIAEAVILFTLRSIFSRYADFTFHPPTLWIGVLGKVSSLLGMDLSEVSASGNCWPFRQTRGLTHYRRNQGVSVQIGSWFAWTARKVSWLFPVVVLQTFNCCVQRELLLVRYSFAMDEIFLMLQYYKQVGLQWQSFIIQRPWCRMETGQEQMLLQTGAASLPQRSCTGLCQSLSLCCGKDENKDEDEDKVSWCHCCSAQPAPWCLPSDRAWGASQPFTEPVSAALITLVVWIALLGH